MAGIACVGRIQKTGIWILQHKLIGQPSGAFSAQVGQAACPSGASTLPNMGKHVAPVGQILYSLTGS